MSHRLLSLLASATLALCACAGSSKIRHHADAGNSAGVVFVCEHGAAKSVVAAAYFNRLANERHLPIRAVARGLAPQDRLSKSATDGLRADGLSAEVAKPIALSESEAHSATRLVSFLPVPAELVGERSFIEWDDVPATADGYGAARDKIVAHVQALLDELAAQKN